MIIHTAPQFVKRLDMFLIFHTNIIPMSLDAHVIIDENMHTIWFEYLALSVYLLSPENTRKSRNAKCMLPISFYTL